MQMSPDMLDDYAGLRPLKNAALILAKYDKWGPLYDLEQLARNEVKVTAASFVPSLFYSQFLYNLDCILYRYFDDMYVDFDLAQDTVAKVRNTEQFVTNQMFHDALRKHTKEVLGKLFEISKREYH